MVSRQWIIGMWLVSVLLVPVRNGVQAAERPDGPVDAAQCVNCHAGFQPALVHAWRSSGHGAGQAGCVSCHGTVHDGSMRARQDATCIDCHGVDTPAVHSYTTSKHGILVKLESAGWDWTQPLRAANYRAPGCAYCHLYAGEHDTQLVITDPVDPVAMERAHDATRAVCYDCHAPRYIARQEQTGVRMIEIARMKWREGEALLQIARGVRPDAELAEALRLLERMQVHVDNVRLGIAHQSPDYQWWHGQPALDGDLLRIKGELSRLERVKQPVGAGVKAPPHASPMSN